MADRSLPSHMANTVCPWTRPRISVISRPGSRSEFNSRTVRSDSVGSGSSIDALCALCSRANVTSTTRIPPKRASTSAPANRQPSFGRRVSHAAPTAAAHRTAGCVPGSLRTTRTAPTLRPSEKSRTWRAEPRLPRQHEQKSHRHQEVPDQETNALGLRRFHLVGHDSIPDCAYEQFLFRCSSVRLAPIPSPRILLHEFGVENTIPVASRAVSSYRPSLLQLPVSHSYSDIFPLRAFQHRASFMRPLCDDELGFSSAIVLHLCAGQATRANHCRGLRLIFRCGFAPDSSQQWESLVSSRNRTRSGLIEPASIPVLSTGVGRPLA